MKERLGLVEGQHSRAGACRRVAVAMHVYRIVRLEVSLRTEALGRISDLELLRQIAISASNKFSVARSLPVFSRGMSS